MSNNWCFKHSASCIALAMVAARCVSGAAPAWLRTAATAPVQTYASGVSAVVLLDERSMVVKDSGDITTLHRRAYRILRPQGRTYGKLVVMFDKDTRITGLGGWSIAPQGRELEVKAKDAVETGYSSETLYDDTRRSVLTIPAAEPGNVIGYEYEQKERPQMLQSICWFQDLLPIRQARFTLQLPAGWEFRSFWRNHADVKPRQESANRWIWDLDNIPALETEPFMPPLRTLGASLAVSFLPSRDYATRRSADSWREIGLWYTELAAARRESTPAIRRKALELSAGEQKLVDKMRRVAAYVQREIRYVAIEIGIGGQQPHFARDVFTHGYGDCKDKVTLLAAMLHEIGVDSYYALLHTDRGVIDPGFPTALSFNHVVIAIRLPSEIGHAPWNALVNHSRFGRLLFFDPTDPVTPFGSLPAALQANTALLVSSDGGELFDLPLAAPSANRLERTGRLRLNAEGELSGDVTETYSGNLAAHRRSLFQETAGVDRARHIETFLASFVNGKLEKAAVQNLDQPDDVFGLHYSFTASNYARRAGDLLLVRARVLGGKAGDPPAKDRKYGIEFPAASEESDTFEIAMPEGYQVDEVPPAVSLEYPFGSYTSRTEISGTMIRYQRTFTIKQVWVAPDRLHDLAEFYRRIAADERSSVVLQARQPGREVGVAGK